MKTRKLNLEELQVKSFVTVLENEQTNNVIGGAETDICVTANEHIEDPTTSVQVDVFCDVRIGG